MSNHQKTGFDRYDELLSDLGDSVPQQDPDKVDITMNETLEEDERMTLCSPVSCHARVSLSRKNQSGGWDRIDYEFSSCDCSICGGRVRVWHSGGSSFEMAFDGNEGTFKVRGKAAEIEQILKEMDNFEGIIEDQMTA